jgi:iron only hydrogenase large subunit-like protein
MFSGIVKIADIDDYITPSQNCIKPISQNPSIKNMDNDKSNQEIKGKKVKLKIGSNNEIGTDFSSDFLEPDLIKVKNPETKSAKITLNDCLACNGCVTTAETLLIQAQSVDEFLKNSVLENKISICCISPQSIQSLAYYFDMSENDAFEKMCSILENVGIKFVLNYNTIVKYCLDKAYEEFSEKVLNNNSNGFNNDKNYIISSECPGWICYAEKKIGEWIIPFLSKIKSPQQVMGNFLKNSFGNLFPEKEIYLSCIMPCFDKKLEATRENHKDNKNNLEVDTVISTIEILDLLSKLNIDFPKYIPKERQNVFYSFSKLVKLFYEKSKNKLEYIIENKNNKLDEIYEQDLMSSIFYTETNYSSNGYV